MPITQTSKGFKWGSKTHKTRKEALHAARAHYIENPKKRTKKSKTKKKSRPSGTRSTLKRFG